MKTLLAWVGGLLLLSACQNGQESGYGNNYGTAADSVGGPGIDALASTMPKVVKKAELRFEVRDVQQGSLAIGQLARRLGGALTYVRVEAEETSQRRLPQGADSVLLLRSVAPKAQLSVRLPPAGIDEFLQGAAGLASFLRYSELQLDDQSLRYLEAQWRNEARNRVLQRAGQPSPRRIDSAGLALMDDVVTNRLTQTAIDGQVALSTINLELTGMPQVARSVVVNTELDHYGVPFGKRVSDALAGGLQIFGNVLLFFVQAWWLLLLFAVAWFVSRKWIKNAVAGAPRAGA